MIFYFFLNGRKVTKQTQGKYCQQKEQPREGETNDTSNM